MSNPMVFFFSGIYMITFAFSGLFFLKFWRASHERLFLLFSFACGLIALERIVFVFFGMVASSVRTPLVESHSWVYCIRLAAFLLISGAVFDRNRSKKKSKKPKVA